MNALATRKPHPHAELLRQIADGEEFETRRGDERHYASPSQVLRLIAGDYVLGKGITIHVKPRTIRIGEFDVPEPLREAPALRERYFYANMLADEGYGSHIWSDDTTDNKLLNLGIVHSDMDSAAKHGLALASLSRSA